MLKLQLNQQLTAIGFSEHPESKAAVVVEFGTIVDGKKNVTKRGLASIAKAFEADGSPKFLNDNDTLKETWEIMPGSSFIVEKGKAKGLALPA
jgi:hypothetical protein